MEEWRIIYDFPNYSVSNYGQVRNNTTGRILKPNTSTCDYLRVTLYIDKKKNRPQKCIHKLVAEAFLPNWNNLEFCDHKNRDRTDNRYFNLRWINRSNNSRNRRKQHNTSSKYFGVSFHKSNNIWRTITRINGKQIHIGYFKTEKEGALAYNEYIIKHNLQEYSPMNVIA